MQIQQMPIEALIPYARNSRTHDDAQVAQIAASIREFGFTNPVLVDAEGGIIAGHGRVMAARKLGLAEVPCIELSHLTDVQKRAYVIADNKIAINSGWNEDMLKLELDALVEEGFDIELTGFSLDELQDMEVEEIPPNEKDDAVPELPVDPVTKPGDVWVLGRHRVMCGDSTSIESFEKLMAGDKADFCFTSPPYNAARGKGAKTDRLGGNGFYGDGYTDDKTSDEYIQFNTDIISTLDVVGAKDFTLCYNINYNKNSPSEYIDVVASGKRVIPLVETIVWEKLMAISLQGDNLTRIFEFIFVFAKGKFKINKNRTDCLKNLWKISNIGANHDIHKACFPVALVEEGIKNFCPHGGKVVEPFGGSGTTMIAAEKLGCSSYLMELDPKYVDVIVKRWQDFTGKAATLEATGQTFAELDGGN
jgi:DNA modification methylase